MFVQQMNHCLVAASFLSDNTLYGVSIVHNEDSVLDVVLCSATRRNIAIAARFLKLHLFILDNFLTPLLKVHMNLPSSARACRKHTECTELGKPA